MNDYIKKSDAVDVIVKYPYDIAGKTATAIKMIEDLPSAEVVPKSEVDRLIDKWIGDEALTQDEKTLRLIEALRDEAKRYERYYFNHEYDKLIAEAKSELASEIFAEIYERLLLSFPAQSFIDAPCTTHDRLFNMVAELKKKYTEGEG